MFIRTVSKTYPHIEGIAVTGESSLSFVAANQLTLTKVVFNKQGSRARFLIEALDHIISSDSLGFALMEKCDDLNFIEQEKIRQIYSIFASINSEIVPCGVSIQEDQNVEFLIGIPGPVQVDLIHKQNRVSIYFDRNFVYKDESTGLFTFIHRIKINDTGALIFDSIEENRNEYRFPKIHKHKILEKLSLIFNTDSMSILSYSENQEMLIDAKLVVEHRLVEKEGFILFDTEKNSISLCSIQSKEEFNLSIASELNNVNRGVISKNKEVVSFANSLNDNISQLKSFGLNILSANVVSCASYNNFKIQSLAWKKILEQNQFSYFMLKEALELVIAYGDQVGSATISDFESSFKKLCPFFLQVEKADGTSTSFVQSKAKRELVCEDSYLSTKQETIVNLDLDKYKEILNDSILSAKQRISQISLIYDNEYSELIALRDKILNERSKAINNVLLSAGAAKTFLDQIEAVLNLECRSWWNNSFGGIVRSFFDVKISGAKVEVAFNEEKWKQVYNRISSQIEYKYERCDYWIILRSGSPDHSYFGKGNSDRTQEDWRFFADDYPITIPESSLNNLGVSFINESPLTATHQYYIDCGKKRTVVNPVKQVPRPKLTFKEFGDKFSKVIEKLYNDNIETAKLIINAQEVVKDLDDQFDQISLKIGELEAKNFGKIQLESQVLNWEDRLLIAKQNQNVDQRFYEFEEVDTEESIEAPEAVYFDISRHFSVVDINEYEKVPKKKVPYNTKEVIKMVEYALNEEQTVKLESLLNELSSTSSTKRKEIPPSLKGLSGPNQVVVIRTYFNSIGKTFDDSVTLSKIASENSVVDIKEFMANLKNRQRDLKKNILFDGNPVDGDTFSLSLFKVTLDFKIELEEQETDVLVKYRIILKDYVRMPFFKEGKLRINGYEATYKDMLLLIKCIESLESNSAQLIKDSIKDLYGVSTQEIEQDLVLFQEEFLKLRKSFQFSKNSFLAYIICQSSKTTFATVLSLFKTKSIPVAKEYGAASAAFIIKMLKEINYVN